MKRLLVLTSLWSTWNCWNYSFRSRCKLQSTHISTCSTSKQSRTTSVNQFCLMLVSSSISLASSQFAWFTSAFNSSSSSARSNTSFKQQGAEKRLAKSAKCSKSGVKFSNRLLRCLKSTKLSFSATFFLNDKSLYTKSTRTSSKISTVTE